MNESNLGKSKNMRYVYQLILRQVKRGEKDIYKKVWQINLNAFDYFKKGMFIYRSYIMEESLHIKRSDEIEIIDINLEKLGKLSYNDIKEEANNSLEKLLYVFTCEDKEKRKELYRNNEIMEKVNDKLEDLTEDFDSILFYDREEFRKKESEELGETRKAKEIAKKLLAKGMPESDIKEVTGLTKKDIDDLKTKEDD